MSGYAYAAGEVEARRVTSTSYDLYARGEYLGVVLAKTPQLAELLAHAIADYGRLAAASEMAEWADSLAAFGAPDLGGEG